MNNKATNKIVDRVDNAFFALADWSIQHRVLVTLATFTLFIVGLAFASKVQIDNSIDSFFYKQDPAYIAYLDYLEDFSSDEVIYLMYSAPEHEHGPFDLEVMRTVANLTKTLELEIPFARKVTSLANVEFMRPVGEDDIEIDELLINFPETQAELLTLREAVLEKPIYRNYLINDTADYAAIIVQMEVSTAHDVETIRLDKNKPADTENLYPVVSDRALREILNRPEFTAQGIEFFISGDVPMNTSYQDLMLGDTVLITGISLLIILGLCATLFRATVAGIVGPLAVVLASVALTIGFLGVLGWKVGNFFTMLPTLLCAVGVAQSVHILLEFQRQLANLGDRKEAAKAALHKVGGPCLMAALTTAAGFAVMLVSDLRMLAEFAVYSSFGIITTFIFSSTLLVIFLGGKNRKNDIARQGKPFVSRFVTTAVDRAISINLARPNTVLIVFGLAFVVAFVGILQLRNDFSFLHEFKPSVQWRIDTEKIEKEMGGTLRMSYLIDTQTPDGIKNPALLQQMEKIQRFAEQNPLVKKTLSLADVIKDLNQTFHNNNRDYFVIPNEQDLLAQYFLVYEMSGGEELEEFTSYDFSRTVIEFQVEMTYASETRKILKSIDDFIAQNPLPSTEAGLGIEGRKTGIGLLWVKLADHIQTTQIQSYTLVFSMIALFMCINFGSIKVGLLSMIPNLTPIIIALGGLGWAGVPLDYMKLLLATIAIGIAVDDTIHLVTRFRSRFYSTGRYADALKLGLQDVGPALTVTSIVLVTAFASYLLSSTTVLSNFGVLLSATIATALLADLFLMPVLLMKLKPFGAEFTIEDE